MSSVGEWLNDLAGSDRPTEAQVDYLNRSRALIVALRVTLGCPDGESLLWHAERVMGELHRLRDERRAGSDASKEPRP